MTAARRTRRGPLAAPGACGRGGPADVPQPGGARRITSTTAGRGALMATEIRETEKKYDFEPGALLPSLHDLQRAEDVLPAAVRHARRRLRRRARRTGLALAGRARESAPHETRKAAKDARYVAEAASLTGGKKARRTARRMKKVQVILGDHHDAVVARDIGMRAHLAGENAFSFGLLQERCQHDALGLEEHAAKTWPSVFGLS